MKTQATHTILADKTVSVSELKKSPSKYFTGEPIAVLSNNQTTGYVLGASLYEALVSMLNQCQQSETLPGAFKPTAERMRKITAKGMELLQNATSEDIQKLGQYSK